MFLTLHCFKVKLLILIDHGSTSGIVFHEFIFKPLEFNYSSFSEGLSYGCIDSFFYFYYSLFVKLYDVTVQCTSLS